MRASGGEAVPRHGSFGHTVLAVADGVLDVLRRVDLGIRDDEHGIGEWSGRWLKLPRKQFAEAAQAFGVASKRPLRTLVTRLPRPLLPHRRLAVPRGLRGEPSCGVGPVKRVTIGPEGTRPHP